MELKEIVEMLYDESIPFNLKYKSTQWWVEILGASGNKLVIKNYFTESLEGYAVIYANGEKDPVFKTSSIKLLINQIRILARLIGA